MSQYWLIKIHNVFSPMKKERIRNLKSLMKILRTNGFRDPIQVIVECDFLLTVDKVENGMEVILRYFDAFPKFFVPACEFGKYKKELGDKKFGDFSSQCEILKCDCGKKSKCLYENKIIKEKNAHHYILATNKLFFCKMYKKLGVPLLKIVKSVPIFDIGDMRQVKVDYKGQAATGKELKKLKKMFN